MIADVITMNHVSRVIRSAESLDVENVVNGVEHADRQSTMEHERAARDIMAARAI
jgi:hypothetical protein